MILSCSVQNDWVTDKQVMGKRDYTRIEFKMSFGRISYIAQMAGGRFLIRHR